MPIAKGGVSREGQIAQETFEIENHIHNNASWLGLAATPSGETHRADRVAPGVGVFQVDAGNNDWGTAIQVIGSSDTPIRTVTPANTKFDLRRILITNAEGTNQTYFLRVICGDSAAAGVSAGTYTEVAMHEDLGNSDHSPTEITNNRIDAGEKVWIQAFAPTANTSTLDFWLEVHEYPR